MNTVIHQSRELISRMAKAYGYDDLASALIGILYFEPKEVSLEYLTEQSGYSLASISNAVAELDRAGIIQKSRKAKSKKTYCFMPKNLCRFQERAFLELAQQAFTPALHILPTLLKDAKGEKEIHTQLIAFQTHIQKMQEFISQTHKSIS